MKTKDKIVKMAYAKTGFTIIELLTVMSIIVILLGMIIPSLNAVRRYAKVVTQKGQFHDIGKGLEMFSIEFDGYPDSSALDIEGDDYCGAMKLCEAMVGQDGLGFHPDSVFDDMGRAIDGATELYFNRAFGPVDMTNPLHVANLQTRKVKYMEGAEIQIASIEELFPVQSTFDPCCAVLCDVFKRTDLRNAAGDKLGMPVLYYKADPSKLTHDANGWSSTLSETNIYNYWDNDELLAIAPPWMASTHPLYDGAGVAIL